VEAQRKLISHAQTMERYFTSNGKYISSGTTCGPATTGASRYYTYADVCNSDTTFTITASPINDTSQEGDGNLSLDNTGARTSSPDGKWKN
ncbi:MAG: type IV pilin protein, partial [Betaproteobacteria bacterium]